MTAASDTELMQEFAERRSESAFAELVQRHVNLVYSVALRYVGNSQDAQDATQAVFIILAQKAASLRQRATLTGWLYETARFTAARLVRTRARRQAREREAYMQSTLDDSETECVWRQLAPLLEQAMSRLSEKERALVALRFFENKTAREAAALLRIEEWAAHKRAARALEKLRRFFLKRGIASTTAVLAGAISTHAVQAAPVALAQSATALALAKGTVAGGTTFTLARATLLAMKTKTLLAPTAVALLVLSIGTFIVLQPKANPAPPPAARHETLPIKFPNDAFIGQANSQFLNDLDAGTQRTANSGPAGHIKCLVAPTSTGSADYLNSVPSAFAPGLTTSRNFRYVIGADSSLLGHRIRISGWMKAREVNNWAGVSLVVMGKDGRLLAADMMHDRPIHGTTDWQPIEMVTDLPKESCSLHLGPTLYGTGEIWCDDFQLDVVPPGTLTTDDGNWAVWSQDPGDYSAATDYDVTHNGHETICVAYTGPFPPLKYAFIWWGQHTRDREKFRRYLGHTVRMSAWVKSENVLGNSGLNFEPKDGAGQRLAKHSAFARLQIKGTTDWTLRSVTCLIPEETQDFQIGFFMFGCGKLWIDRESIKCEVVK